MTIASSPALRMVTAESLTGLDDATASAKGYLFPRQVKVFGNVGWRYVGASK